MAFAEVEAKAGEEEGTRTYLPFLFTCI
jgi:hypothetical protein